VLAVRLPVAGRDVVLRSLVGSDDILLSEAAAPDLALALALLGELGTEADGAPLEPAQLPIGDVDVLLLRLRQRLVGDGVSADELCAAPGCRARVDIGFAIGAYLAHHSPESAPDVGPADGAGWSVLAGEEIAFRLPLAADQLAIARAADPEQELLRRCVRPAALAAATRARVEAAMEALAPSLSAELTGTCPACGTTVVSNFDPVSFTLRELRDRAAFVYDDVWAIAHHTHWSETDILALPSARRARYAELARVAGAQRARG
jgi:hypothetical protein